MSRTSNTSASATCSAKGRVGRVAASVTSEHTAEAIALVESRTCLLIFMSPQQGWCRDLNAVHHAAVPFLVEWQRTMHRAAVVPDDQVTHLPAVLVSKARLRGKRAQLPQQRIAFLVFHADHRTAMLLAARIEAALTRFRMGPHDRMLHVRQPCFFLVGERGRLVIKRVGACG